MSNVLGREDLSDTRWGHHSVREVTLALQSYAPEYLTLSDHRPFEAGSELCDGA